VRAAERAEDQGNRQQENGKEAESVSITQLCCFPHFLLLELFHGFSSPARAGALFTAERNVPSSARSAQLFVMETKLIGGGP
jgi:hypothetical protein